MERKACRKQHPGGVGDGVPHINNMSDQRIRSTTKTERSARQYLFALIKILLFIIKNS